MESVKQQSIDVIKVLIGNDNYIVPLAIPRTLVSYLINNVEWARKMSAQKIIEFLIEAGGNINEVNSHNQTALHEMINGKRFDVALILLDLAADPSAKDKNLKTPLHLAVQNKHVHLIEKLLEKEVDINAVDDNYWSPLCHAVQVNSYEMVKILLDHGASTDTFRRARFDPLLQAVVNENYKLVELLLERTPGDLDLEKINRGYTYLQIAAIHRRGDIVIKLLEHGAKLSTNRSAEGHGVLYYATRPTGKPLNPAEQNELLKSLIKEGVREDLDLFEKIEIFDNAVLYANEQTLRSLVKHVLDLSEYPANQYDTLLQRAIENKHDSRVFKFIVEKVRFDVRKKVDESGNTLLHLAAKMDNYSVVKYLLKAGCDVDCKADWGRTPLHEAVKKVNQSCVRLLLNCNADVSSVDYLEEDCALGMAMMSFYDGRGIDIVYHIIRRIAVLESLDKPVYQTNYDIISLHENLTNFYQRCKAELKSMRECYIYDKVLFFDLFMTPEKYSRNFYVIEIFEGDSILESFEIYCDTLKEKFNKVLKRQRLIERAEAGLERILQCESKSFAIVFDNILKYLSNRDLRNLTLI